MKKPLTNPCVWMILSVALISATAGAAGQILSLSDNFPILVKLKKIWQGSHRESLPSSFFFRISATDWLRFGLPLHIDTKVAA
jgi:hypothetical protein